MQLNTYGANIMIFFETISLRLSIIWNIPLFYSFSKTKLPSPMCKSDFLWNNAEWLRCCVFTLHL